MRPRCTVRSVLTAASPRNQRYLQGEVVRFWRPLRLYGGPQHGCQVSPQVDLKRIAALVWREHDGRINIFKTTPDPAKVEFVGEWGGFQIPLDLIVNEDSVWVTDLGPLRFTKLDMSGKHLYTWMVPRELPDGYLEAHTITVDSAGNLYAGDNQYGRSQKFVPKPDADKSLLIGVPWSGR